MLKTPTTKINWLVTGAAAVMIVSASIILISKSTNSTGSNHMLPVSVRPLKMGDGWGYEVLVNDKVYIKQDCIPAIAGYKKFQTEEEALQIGNSVAYKLKHGQKPITTIREIRDAHIHY